MKYVALLRGINVGGKNKISMAELKTSFEKLGFFDVKTYINSCNIIFSATESASELTEIVETGIKNTFHLDIPVLIRSQAEIDETVRAIPNT
jgi:uncharacterized protein (DUF1697 family)